jgi:hypothetical protein
MHPKLKSGALNGGSLPSVGNPRPALSDNSARASSSMAGCAVPWIVGMGPVVGVRGRFWFRDVDRGAVTRFNPSLFDDDRRVRAGTAETHVASVEVGRGVQDKGLLVER